MASKDARSYSFQNSSQAVYQQPLSVQHNGKVFPDRKTICIMRPNNSKEVSQMAQGVVSAFMNFIERPHIIPVVGDNNIVGLTKLFYDIMHRHPRIDMIFSLGESSTKVAQKVVNKLGSKVPIFFAFISEKAASYVMKQSSNITGVIAPLRDYTDQFKSFFYFTQYDRTKKILIPRARFDRGLGGAYIDEGSFHLASLLTSYKVEAQLVEVICHEDLHTKLKPLLSDIGLLALPRDTVLEAYAYEFIEMANERRVPLFSSSIEAVEQGVGISFGRPGNEFSREVALLTQPILVDGVHPSNFPVIRVKDWAGTMGINREAAAQQGLKLNIERVCTDENVMLL